MFKFRPPCFVFMCIFIIYLHVCECLYKYKCVVIMKGGLLLQEFSCLFFAERRFGDTCGVTTTEKKSEGATNARWSGSSASVGKLGFERWGPDPRGPWWRHIWGCNGKTEVAHSNALQCTMQLSFSKNENYRFNPDSHHSPHFLAVK